MVNPREANDSSFRILGTIKGPTLHGYLVRAPKSTYKIADGARWSQTKTLDEGANYLLIRYVTSQMLEAL